MARWERRQLRLKQDHGWKAKPNYQIIVVDRGALRLDVPKGWVMEMETDPNTGQTTLDIRDRRTPDDACRLQVTVIYLPPGLDSYELQLSEALEHAMSGPDEYEVLGRSHIIHEQRRDLELAWTETRFIDPGENREARSRTCVTHRADLAALLTFTYWPEDGKRFLPIWEEIRRSLRLGEYVQDPTRGPGH